MQVSPLRLPSSSREVVVPGYPPSHQTTSVIPDVQTDRVLV